MKNANSTFHESLLFQKKLKSLNKNEKVLNRRKIQSSNNNIYKQEFFNNTQNLFYTKKISLPINNNKISRINSVSDLKQNFSENTKILPGIINKKVNKDTNTIRNKCSSSKSFIKHPLNYLNLSDNLIIKEKKNNDRNNKYSNINANKLIKSANDNHLLKQNLSFYSRNLKKNNFLYRNRDSYNNNYNNSVSIKILNPEIEKSNNIKINKLNQKDFQLKKLLENKGAKNYKNNKEVNNFINNNISKLNEKISNILLKINSLNQFNHNDSNSESLFTTFLNQVNKSYLDLPKNIKNIEQNKANNYNENFPVIKYIFFDKIINNLKRKINLIDISSEKDFNQNVLRIIDEELYSSTFNNNLIRNQINKLKDFKTYGFEFNPEEMLKKKYDSINKNNNNTDRSYLYKSANLKIINKHEINLSQKKTPKNSSEQNNLSNNNNYLSQLVKNRNPIKKGIKYFENTMRNNEREFNENKLLLNNKNTINKKNKFSQTDRHNHIFLHQPTKNASLEQSEINKIILSEFRSILNSNKLNFSLIQKDKDKDKTKITKTKNKEKIKINLKNKMINYKFIRRTRKLYTINRKIIRPPDNIYYFNNYNIKRLIHTRIYKTLNNSIYENENLNNTIDENLNNITNNNNKSISFDKKKRQQMSNISKKYILSLFLENENENKNKNINTKYKFNYPYQKRRIEINNNNSKNEKSKSFNNSPNKTNTSKKSNKKSFSNLHKKQYKFKKKKNHHKLNKSRSILNYKKEDMTDDLLIIKEEKLQKIDKSPKNKKKNTTKYELDKILYMKNKMNYENLKIKLDEIEEKNQRIKIQKLKKKLKTSILNMDYDKTILPIENLFMKKLKEEKYRNVIKKLTTQRKVDKNEYNQLKLDLNIMDSSDEDLYDENENEHEHEHNNSKYFENEKKNNSKASEEKEDSDLYENEINFFGADLIIKQSKKEKVLYDKYIKLKRLKLLKDLKQIKKRNIFRRELKEGMLNENDENSKINKKFVRKKQYNRRKSKIYFKYLRKKFVKSLEDEYDSDNSISQEFNYFVGVDENSIKQIEKRKEEVLLKFKNDILYKISVRQLTFNELSLYDELVSKLRDFENNLSNEKYVKLLQSYFHNLDKQIKLSEQRKLKEQRINKYMNNLIDDMDFLSYKKKKQETTLCHVLNYKDFNHINILNDTNLNK